MISFFRSLRRRLLLENKFGRFILYGIGEIFLVMVGILLALQVNNLNEDRKSTNEKNLYCQQLMASLQSDFENMRSFRQRLNIVEDKGMNLWRVITEEAEIADTNQITSDFLMAAVSFDFSPNPTAYNNLINTNGLGLIKSDSLKTLFASYYLLSKGRNEIAEQRLRYAASYNDLRFEFSSPMLLKFHLHELFKMGDGDEFQKTIDFGDYSVDWHNLKRSKEFEIVLGRLLAVREAQFNELNNSQRDLKKMIDLLKTEIQ